MRGDGTESWAHVHFWMLAQTANQPEWLVNTVHYDRLGQKWKLRPLLADNRHLFFHLFWFLPSNFSEFFTINLINALFTIAQMFKILNVGCLNMI